MHAGNAFRVTPKDPSEAKAALISSAQRRPQAADYSPQKPRPVIPGGVFAATFRFSVICVRQTSELPGFKDPAREMPTPLSEYIPLRTALRRRQPAYFFRRGGNLGMKGNSTTALRG